MSLTLLTFAHATLLRLCCTNRVMTEVPLSPDGLIPRLP